MSLISCPECNKEISDKALACPNCGYPVRESFYGFEYRSKKELFGLPLVHIVSSRNFSSIDGKPHIAKGIIAIGPIAIGGLALGGLSIGVISVGGLALGFIAIAGAAMGLLFALGGMAIGLVAIGGAAIGYYAMGGGAWGVHPLGSNTQDPQAIEFFRRYFSSWFEQFRRGR